MALMCTFGTARPSIHSGVFWVPKRERNAWRSVKLLKIKMVSVPHIAWPCLMVMGGFSNTIMAEAVWS